MSNIPVYVRISTDRDGYENLDSNSGVKSYILIDKRTSKKIVEASASDKEMAKIIRRHVCAIVVGVAYSCKISPEKLKIDRVLVYHEAGDDFKSLVVSINVPNSVKANLYSIARLRYYIPKSCKVIGAAVPFHVLNRDFNKPISTWDLDHSNACPLNDYNKKGVDNIIFQNSSPSEVFEFCTQNNSDDDLHKYIIDKSINRIEIRDLSESFVIPEENSITEGVEPSSSASGTKNNKSTSSKSGEGADAT